MNDDDKPTQLPDASTTQTVTTTTGPAAPALPPVPTHGAAMRRALLARLPQLGVRASGSDQWFGLDEESELRAALEPDADALLEPLEAAARETHGS